MNTNKILRLCILGISIVSGSAVAQLYPSSEAMKSLTEATSLKCDFKWYGSVDWDSDNPSVERGEQKFGFHIDGLNFEEGKARLIGNAGATDLGLIVGEMSISFLEVTPVGAVNVTTVYGWRNNGNRFKAVHSRHTAIGGPTPSQNYGDCQLW